MKIDQNHARHVFNINPLLVVVVVYGSSFWVVLSVDMPECPSLPGRPLSARLVLGEKGSVGVSTPEERTSTSHDDSGTTTGCEARKHYYCRRARRLPCRRKTKFGRRSIEKYALGT
jgi:hypothetical protein